MQCLPRVALSPSVILARQLRHFRLLPSLRSEAQNANDNGAPSESTSGGIESSYDMVIVGDGPVSSALACSIGCEPSLTHKKVLLLQSQEEGDEEEAESGGGKVSVLLQPSVKLLKRFGVWPELVAKSVVKPFKSVHIWDASSEAHVVFNHSDLSHDTPEDDDLIVHGLHSDDQSKTSDSSDGTMGYVVRNQSLMSSLVENLGSYGNIQLETKTKAKDIRKMDQDDLTRPLVQVTLDNGQSVTSNLLVGSDGPNSKVRQLCGFSSIVWSCDQWAFTAAFDVKEAGRNLAVWQRLLPTGPITMLPLSDSTSALMWCTNKEHAQSLVSMSDPATVVDAVNAAFYDTLPQGDLIASFSDAVRDTMGIFSSETPPPHQLPPLATFLQESSRAAVPLAVAHAPNYVKDRIILIGDASHQIHPLTGHGLNLGLGDVATLTEKLLEANSRGDDWGSLPHLLEYETERQRENVPTMAAVEGFNWLYSSNLTPFILMRAVGFNVTNSFPPLRDFLARQTWEPNSP